jgi:carboxypeptidase Taq
LLADVDPVAQEPIFVQRARRVDEHHIPLVVDGEFDLAVRVLKSQGGGVARDQLIDRKGQFLNARKLPVVEPRDAVRRMKMNVETKLKKLRARLQEISHLGGAAVVLSWDQATYMPPGGAQARAKQFALIRRIEHERMTSPALGRLLDELANYGGRHDGHDARLITLARREFEKAIRVPASFVERASTVAITSYYAWQEARRNNDFAAMLPSLERSLDLTREFVEFFGPYEHLADPLIASADEGLTCAVVRALFEQLRAELVPLVDSICDLRPADDSCLRVAFAEAPQLEFRLAVAKAYGYDLARGRLDTTAHPFCMKLSPGDVRIVTRMSQNQFSQGLFSTLHEVGHALYEQGVAPELAGTPVGKGVSAAIHESQARLWENVVGRSRNFWQHYYPKLQEAFPDQLDKVPLQTFYHAVNKVERSLIRTDADEITYNLHVILRFDLELDLLEGKLAAKDLPQAWRARYQSDLAISPADDRDGCLQDMHWYCGVVGGAFHSYAIGNILAAQFYAAALRAHPNIPVESGRGEFGTLRNWLAENLYRHGCNFTPTELVMRTTGEPMTIKPYIAYLRTKYGELYRPS